MKYLKICFFGFLIVSAGITLMFGILLILESSSLHNSGSFVECMSELRYSIELIPREMGICIGCFSCVFGTSIIIYFVFCLWNYLEKKQDDEETEIDSDEDDCEEDEEIEVDFDEDDY